MRKPLTMTLAVTALAMNAVACHLQVEQILAVQPGSEMVIATTTPLPSSATQPLEGGTVMNIDIVISLFDLILGDFEGDIAVDELLIAAPGFNFLGLLATGIICVVPDEVDPGGGTFEANIYTNEATFDVALNTSALFGNPVINAGLGGGLPFPFELVSTIPFGLSEMLGLLTGSTDLEITQPISQPINLTTQPPLPPIAVTGNISGQITLASADAFPTSPLLDACIAFLAQ